MGLTAGELIVSIIGDMEGLKKVFRDVQTEISGMSQEISKRGKELSSAGASMTAGITAPILAVAAGIGVSVNAASDFDTQMRRVSTMLPGITKEGFDKISGQSLALSKQFGSDTADINNAMYQALSSGIPQDNIFEFMQTSEKLAIGGATDVTTAVDGLTSVVNSYGASQITAAHASDVMFTGTKLGKSTIEELSKQMADVVSIAAPYKISFEDVNASLATMTIQGTRTNVATTQLRSMILELTDETSAAAQAFKQITGESFTDFIAKGGTVGEAIQIMNKSIGEYIPTQKDMNKFTKEFNDPASQMSQRFNDLTGKSFQQFIKEGGSVQQAMKIMGVEGEKTTKTVSDLFTRVEAKTGVMQLSGEGAKIYAADMKEMGNAAGSTDQAYKTMAEGVGKSTDIMKADFKAFVIEAGNSFMPVFQGTIVPFVKETLIPALQKILPVIVSIMTAFGNLSPTLQVIIIGLIGLLAAAGPVLIIIGAMASAIGAVAALFATGGLLASGGAVMTALGTAIGLLASPIAILIGVVALLAIAWNRDWGGIQEKARAVWDFIMNTADKLYNRLEYNYHAIIMAEATLRDRINDTWNAISSIFSKVINAIMGLVSGWYTHSKTNFDLVVSILQILLTGWRLNWTEIQAVLNLAQAAISRVLEILHSTAQNLFNRILAALSSLYSDWRNNWERIQATISAAVLYISDYLSNLYTTTTRRAREIADKLLEPFSSIKDTILSYTSSWYNAGWAILDSLYNGVVDGFNRVIDKAKEELAELSKYLPSSPAKKGPFSKLPNWDAIFVDPMLASVSKMGGTLNSGLNSMAGTLNNITTYQGGSNVVYEGSNISIGPNNLSNSFDINTLIDEINRRATAQRRARGYIL